MKISAQSALLPLIILLSTLIPSLCRNTWLRGGAVAVPSTRQRQTWGAGGRVACISSTYRGFLIGWDVGWFSLLSPQEQRFRRATGFSPQRLLTYFSLFFFISSFFLLGEASLPFYFWLWSFTFTCFHVSYQLTTSSASSHHPPTQHLFFLTVHHSALLSFH